MSEVHGRARTAVVVGGGIAGPVTAMALHKAGIDATVYEAYDRTADGIGAVLSIAPNGLSALAVVGADDAVRAIGRPMRSIDLFSASGKQLASLPSPPGLPAMHLVWRSALLRALLDEATRRGIRVQHGKRLVAVSDLGDEVTATFTDGTTATADVLIGADGLRSTVRGLIDPGAPPPRYVGLLNFGAFAADTGLPSTDGAMHMVFGKRAFVGYQVDADGGAAWFVNLPHPGPVTPAGIRQVGQAEWMRRLRAAVADDRSPAVTLVDRTDPHDLLVIGPTEDLPRVPTWGRGRVVLVGDAAHATSPSSGQGASIAAESAVQLARCLRDLPPAAAFEAYERLRRRRVEKIVAAGARTSQSKAAGPVARVVRDLLMPVAMRRFAAPERMAWQYDHRIDWDETVRVAEVAPRRSVVGYGSRP